MEKTKIESQDKADQFLLRMIEKYGIHILYIVIILELISYLS